MMWEQPVLILPDWVSESIYRDYVGWEQRVEIADTGTAYLARADGEGDWTEVDTTATGVVLNVDRRQHRQLRYEGRLALKKYQAQFDLRGELPERSPQDRWIERWSRHWLNGALGGGWRDGRLRWSWSAVSGLVGNRPGRWGIDRLERWTREDQKPTVWPKLSYEDLLVRKQKLWEQQWAHVLNSITSDQVWEQAGYPPELVNEGFYDVAALAKGGTVTVDMVNEVLQRSWEGPQESPYDQEFGRGAREQAIRQGQTTWDEDEFDG